MKKLSVFVTVVHVSATVVPFISLHNIQYKLNLFIFAAINFRILWLECQIAVRFSLACLISYNGTVKSLRQLIFMKISALRLSQKSLMKLNRFTAYPPSRFLRQKSDAFISGFLRFSL